MPTLAELDDPRPSRLPGILLGIAVALPLAGVFAYFAIGWLPSMILGNAVQFDDRLRQEDAYMQTLCWDHMQLPRDESLCECVLATEFPALDCQAPFLAWSVDRQGEHCAVPENEKAALSFCTCVKTVAELMAAAPDEEAMIKAAQAYPNCQALPDAVYLPAVEEL